ncbi:substrate-binding domain-containing protein [Candidatus Bipolaricaulota bacterium]|nr:substrate-binding domain-containing protein [Candidatus Bipolaricaulota bacterium]
MKTSFLNKNLTILFTLVFTLILFSAPIFAQQEGKPTVALVMKEYQNQFFQRMTNGAVKYQHKNQSFYLMPVGVRNQKDIAGQVSLIEDMMNKVDAMVVAPMDSRALVRPMVQAKKEGLAVVNIDVLLDQDYIDENYPDTEFPYVGPDNVGAAKSVGDILVDQLDPGADVIIIEGVPGASNAVMRTEGFKKAAEEGDFNVLGVHTAHWLTEEALNVFNSLLTKHGDEIDAVMCGNDAMAVGVVRALQQKGYEPGEVKVVGIDADPQAIDLMEQGWMQATLTQYAGAQAIYGIDIALAMLEGKDVPMGWIKTPTKVLTPNDLPWDRPSPLEAPELEVLQNLSD